jgi:hypothetical protein
MNLPSSLEAMVGDPWMAGCKSAEILSRGLNVWNAALFGVASMTIEDAFDAWDARDDCAGLRSRECDEYELTPRLLSAFSGRLSVLARMAMQLGEDAAYPLQRLVGLELERLAPPSAS